MSLLSDPDSFASRYRTAGTGEARAGAARAKDNAKKAHRVKSNNAFKSKAKFRRR
jgi:hypothetical protein